MQKILDLGCGRRKHQVENAQVTGIDVNPACNPDVIHDLDEIPWPFADNEFNEVICQDVLEHLQDLPAAMLEINRVSRAGSRIKIRTPHYSSYYAYNSPDHKHYFGYYAFEYFCREGRGFRMVKRKILFPRIWRISGLSALANRFPRRWEQIFAFIIRAENMYIELEAVK